MLAGSDGLGGVYFDDARLAQAIGITALAFILFSGGLDTRMGRVKPILVSALSLASVGVTLTALAAGLFAAWILDAPILVGLLLGAVISSTGAAAVGKRIIDLHLPPQVLIALIDHSGEHIVPTGSSELLASDRLLIATSAATDWEQVERLLA
jgi:NhaP-type Na+/H+ and K+/H+ antiporter